MPKSHWAGLVAATAVGVLHVAALLGHGYEAVAERGVGRPFSRQAVAAADFATKLMPWSSRTFALAGWLHAEQGSRDAAVAAYTAALRRAPGDGVLWAEYAQALARLGEFGASFTTAVARATALAPASPAVTSAIADLGVTYWTRGGSEARELWLENMHRQLQADRAGFLSRVVARGRTDTFCATAARALGETAWCQTYAGPLATGCFVITDTGPRPCRR